MNLTITNDQNQILPFKRSLTTYSNPPSSSSTTSSSSSSSMRKGLRVSTRIHRACNGCRRQKMRCEGPINGPCNRCQSTGQPCIFEKPKEKKRSLHPAIEQMRERMNDLETEMKTIQNHLKKVESDYQFLSGSTTTNLSSSFSPNISQQYHPAFQAEALTSSYEHHPYSRATTKSRSMPDLCEARRESRQTPPVPLVPSNYFTSSISCNPREKFEETIKKKSKRFSQTCQENDKLDLMTTVSEVMQAVLQNTSIEPQLPSCNAANQIPARTAPVMPSLQCESVNMLPSTNKELGSSPIPASILPTCSSNIRAVSNFTTSQPFVESKGMMIHQPNNQDTQQQKFTAATNQFLQVSQISSNPSLMSVKRDQDQFSLLFETDSIMDPCKPLHDCQVSSMGNLETIVCQSLQQQQQQQQQQQSNRQAFSMAPINQVSVSRSDQMDLISSGIVTSAIDLAMDYSTQQSLVQLQSQSQPSMNLQSIPSSEPGSILTHLPFFQK